MSIIVYSVTHNLVQFAYNHHVYMNKLILSINIIIVNNYYVYVSFPYRFWFWST